MNQAFDQGDLTPEFLNEEEEALFAQAMMGEEAIRFLDSDLGRVLRGMAKQRIERAKDELLRTPAWRKRKIQDLQNQARMGQMFLGYLAELLRDGEVAHQQLKAMRQDHE